MDLARPIFQGLDQAFHKPLSRPCQLTGLELRRLIRQCLEPINTAARLDLSHTSCELCRQSAWVKLI